MPVVPGSNTRQNDIQGVGAALYTSDAENASYNYVPKKGSLIYNKDTQEIKVGDDVTPINNLPDHKHPFTYSPLFHTHMHGTNMPWYLTNPKLWYIDDLENHPELIALDGSELTEEQARYLSEIFPGTALLTYPVPNLTTNGYENDNIILSVTSSVGDFYGGRLCNDTLTVNNFAQVSDQWLSASTSLDHEEIIKISLKGGHTYRPTDYWICPANGISSDVSLVRPTPNTWTFEGSTDGTTWTILDSHSNVTDWSVFTTKFFTVNTPTAYGHFRLKITSWNAGAINDINIGLRRFWIFGKKTGIFHLPDIPAPHPDFAWVVPLQSLNTCMKNEDVGDIGITALMNENIPSYRLPTDGRSVSKSTYSDLFAAIGHRYDPPATSATITASDGTYTDDDWDTGLSDISATAYLTITLPTAAMIGAYSFDSTGCKKPTGWVIEGSNDGSSWTTIQQVSNNTRDGKFYIDTATADTAYLHYRFNVTGWNDEDGDIGLSNMTVYTHPVNNFYLPTIITNDTSITSYIVSRPNTTDLTSDIVQNLQDNIASLTAVVADLQQQLLALSS